MEKFPLLFGPPGLIFLGSLIALIGAFWAASQQAGFERTINKKNEELLLVSKETISQVTGGDSFPSILPIFNLDKGYAHLSIRNHGKYNLLDLNAEFASDGDFPIQLEENKSAMLGIITSNINIERVPKYAAIFRLTLRLDPSKKYSYAINFNAKNGGWHQRLRIIYLNNKWEYASFVRVGPQENEAHKVIYLKASNEAIINLLNEDWPKSVGEFFLK